MELGFESINLSATFLDIFRKSSLHIEENSQHRRRIYTEEKAKVVTAVWGMYLNAAALAI